MNLEMTDRMPGNRRLARIRQLFFSCHINSLSWKHLSRCWPNTFSVDLWPCKPEESTKQRLRCKILESITGSDNRRASVATTCSNQRRYTEALRFFCALCVSIKWAPGQAKTCSFTPSPHPTAYENVEDTCRKFWIKPIKKTALGVVRAYLTPKIFKTE